MLIYVKCEIPSKYVNQEMGCLGCRFPYRLSSWDLIQVSALWYFDFFRSRARRSLNRRSLAPTRKILTASSTATWRSKVVPLAQPGRQDTPNCIQTDWSSILRITSLSYFSWTRLTRSTPTWFRWRTSNASSSKQKIPRSSSPIRMK